MQSLLNLFKVENVIFVGTFLSARWVPRSPEVSKVLASCKNIYTRSTLKKNSGGWVAIVQCFVWDCIYLREQKWKSGVVENIVKGLVTR